MYVIFHQLKTFSVFTVVRFPVEPYFHHIFVLCLSFFMGRSCQALVTALSPRTTSSSEVLNLQNTFLMFRNQWVKLKLQRNFCFVYS